MFFAKKAGILSLAAVKAGDTFEILPSFSSASTNFGRFRTLPPRGQFFCRSAGAAILLLVSDDGRTFSVPRDMARFIPVRRTTP